MSSLKAVARVTALLLVVPSLCSFWVRRWVLGADRALMGSSQAWALIPGVAGQYLRAAFLRCVLQQCAASVTIEFGVIFSRVGARLGERAYIGPMSHIGLVDLGPDVLVAAGVHIPSGPDTHGTSDLDVPIRQQPGTRRMVHIGEGCWIGSAAVVLADVGEHSVIAAGAVVTKPVPAYVVAGGVPASIIRSRTASQACASSS
jgi:acetyltransferase-like isoleucine patch superfamily enzyme